MGDRAAMIECYCKELTATIVADSLACSRRLKCFHFYILFLIFMQKTSVHKLNKSEIQKKILTLRDAGQIYDLADSTLNHDFYTSLDRFADIALKIRHCQKVLDVGSGTGILVGILAALGHEVHALDFFDRSEQLIYIKARSKFSVCNVEADPIPYSDDEFDAVCCCQTLEHFTYAHLPVVLEIKRVLRVGGIFEVDVPNIASFRNRSRVLRGKSVLWDYDKYYLNSVPSEYKGREYFPNRHNHEFTKAELTSLFLNAGFKNISVQFLRDQTAIEYKGTLSWFGSWLRDCIPGMRKSLLGIAVK
jgi:ubiquinone/menaquinone biosynthesis C-methylase UbiE